MGLYSFKYLIHLSSAVHPLLSLPGSTGQGQIHGHIDRQSLVKLRVTKQNRNKRDLWGRWGLDKGGRKMKEGLHAVYMSQII